jgi:hypothetical protein
MDHPYPKRKIPTLREQLASVGHLPERQAPMGWTIYDSHWQVEQIGKNDEVMEKIAYTNFFFAAEAAYNAALIAMPHDRILFRNRMRVIRKSWET